MEIPLVIVYGSELSVERLGWTARRCSRCQRVQAFECFDKWQSNHVYFIHGQAKSVGQIVICDFCETSFGLKANSAEAKSLRCSRMWSKEEGLNALVEKTNPALGHVAVTDKPGRQELFALLESMNERASPYKIKSEPGMFMGMLFGVPAFAILGLLVSLLGLTGLDWFGGAFLGGAIGLFAGAIAGGIKYKWDYSRKHAVELLVATMQRHALTLSTLERALKHHPGKLKYVTWGLTQLTAGT
jgi:uncharacterized CHY-type Zn-finger protein